MKGGVEIVKGASKEVAKEAAKATTKEAAKVTTKEAAKGAAGAASGLASAAAPIIGGLFEGGMALYEEGAVNTKVVAKTGGGVAATLLGGATGVLCGPMAWVCVPAATVVSSYVMSSSVDYLLDEKKETLETYVGQKSKTTHNQEMQKQLAKMKKTSWW
jgi:hypothetical protein